MKPKEVWVVYKEPSETDGGRTRIVAAFSEREEADAYVGQPRASRDALLRVAHYVFEPNWPCDAPGCREEPVFVCDCSRCGREPSHAEKFHSCAEHAECEAKPPHLRMRGRDTRWVPYDDRAQWIRALSAAERARDERLRIAAWLRSRAEINKEAGFKQDDEEHQKLFAATSTIRMRAAHILESPSTFQDEAWGDTIDSVRTRIAGSLRDECNQIAHGPGVAGNDILVGAVAVAILTADIDAIVAGRYP